MHHAFLYTSLPPRHDYNVKLPVLSRFNEDVLKHTTMTKTNFKRVGIIATKYENRRSPLNSDVFAAVAVVVAKAT